MVHVANMEGPSRHQPVSRNPPEPKDQPDRVSDDSVERRASGPASGAELVEWRVNQGRDSSEWWPAEHGVPGSEWDRRLDSTRAASSADHSPASRGERHLGDRPGTVQDGPMDPAAEEGAEAAARRRPEAGGSGHDAELPSSAALSQAQQAIVSAIREGQFDRAIQFVKGSTGMVPALQTAQVNVEAVLQQYQHRHGAEDLTIRGQEILCYLDQLVAKTRRTHREITADLPDHDTVVRPLRWWATRLLPAAIQITAATAVATGIGAPLGALLVGDPVLKDMIKAAVGTAAITTGSEILSVARQPRTEHELHKLAADLATTSRALSAAVQRNELDQAVRIVQRSTEVTALLRSAEHDIEVFRQQCEHFAGKGQSNFSSHAQDMATLLARLGDTTEAIQQRVISGPVSAVQRPLRWWNDVLLPAAIQITATTAVATGIGAPVGAFLTGDPMVKEMIKAAVGTVTTATSSEIVAALQRRSSDRPVTEHQLTELTTELARTRRALTTALANGQTEAAIRTVKRSELVTALLWNAEHEIRIIIRQREHVAGQITDPWAEHQAEHIAKLAERAAELQQAILHQRSDHDATLHQLRWWSDHLLPAVMRIATSTAVATCIGAPLGALLVGDSVLDEMIKAAASSFPTATASELAKPRAKHRTRSDQLTRPPRREPTDYTDSQYPSEAPGSRGRPPQWPILVESSEPEPERPPEPSRAGQSEPVCDDDVIEIPEPPATPARRDRPGPHVEWWPPSLGYGHNRTPPLQPSDDPNDPHPQFGRGRELE